MVETEQLVTLVGAGALGAEDLPLCLAKAPYLVAADAGATACLQAGHMPQKVVGDFDSLNSASRSALPPEALVHVAEQDTTDFDKALRSISAPLVLGAGFTGARMDHHLACMNTLVRRPERRCILLGDTDIVFLCPPALRLNLAAGTRVSLFPMGLVEGASDGLRWPIAGIPLTPDGRIGTSNEATGAVELTATTPRLLVILPRAHLAEAIKSMLAQPATWPAL